MSIRWRLGLLMLLLGTVPLAVVVWWTTSYMEQLAVASGEDVLQEVGQVMLRQYAVAVARQVQAYLEHHPDYLENPEAMRADEGLALVAVQPVGDKGYTLLFDARTTEVYFHPNADIVGVKFSSLAETLPELWEIVQRSMVGSAEGFYRWRDADGVMREKYMVIVPVEGTPLRVAATTYLDEFDEPAKVLQQELQNVTDATRRRFVSSLLVVGAIALIVAVGVGAWLTAPIQEMAQVARRVMEGEWEAVQPLERQDELGDLSRALYAMTLRIRELVQRLEQQVAERTEYLSRRTRYLEATVTIARDAAALLDVEELLARVVELIGEQFGFYHVAIFLISPDGEWVELRAASSEEGRRLLARGHRLRVGDGVVGDVAQYGMARVVLDVDDEEATFDLSGTRSEVALPLRIGSEIIGVLDVQSQEPEAFGDEEVRVLQALADQVAVAIDNARLFRRVQESVEAERRARGEVELAAWRELLYARPDLAFRSTPRGTVHLKDPTQVYLQQPEAEAVLHTEKVVVDEKGQVLAMPIRVSGHVVGVVTGRKPDEAGAWTEDEISLMETLAEQLSVAVERARLYRETQLSAARQRTIAEVGARMRESLELEDMLRVAAQEIRKAMGLSRIVVRMVQPREVQGGE